MWTLKHARALILCQWCQCMTCVSKDAIFIGIILVCCLKCQFKIFKPIDQPTNYEIHSVIRFFKTRNVLAAEIHRQINDIYGPDVISERKVPKWEWTFNDTWTFIVHNELQSVWSQTILSMLWTKKVLKTSKQFKILTLTLEFRIWVIQLCTKLSHMMWKKQSKTDYPPTRQTSMT